MFTRSSSLGEPHSPVQIRDNLGPSTHVWPAWRTTCAYGLRPCVVSEHAARSASNLAVTENST